MDFTFEKPLRKLDFNKEIKIRISWIPCYRSIRKSEKGFAKLSLWAAVFFLLIMRARARPLLLNKGQFFESLFLLFPNRTVKRKFSNRYLSVEIRIILQKNTKVFWHQSDARTTATVWNSVGLVRHCPQGLFSPFFSFLRAIFSRPFRLSLAPTICPWVSEDEPNHKCFSS